MRGEYRICIKINEFYIYKNNFSIRTVWYLKSSKYVHVNIMNYSTNSSDSDWEKELEEMIVAICIN